MDGQPFSVIMGNRSFFLVPEGYEGMAGQSHPQLQRFDDPGLIKLDEYKYNKLPKDKKRIRLLQVEPAASNVSQITCRLIDADYDKDYHILTKPLGLDSEERKLDGKYNAILDNRIKYEALSWCWGEESEDYAITIKQGEKSFYKRRIKKDLALALKYLRKSDKIRTLWIDSICINQQDDSERNHQVQMMSRIYTRAEQVCIWLGESNEQSNVAIKFIKEEVMELNNIDSICSDNKYAHKWQALMMLMQRPWFSRRWMVQEISLARKAKIYCGPDKISWSDFAVAVELFVEVETATHRLSEVMRKDEKFRHIPNWFEHVSELGASLLVQATGKVFRKSDNHMTRDPKTSSLREGEGGSKEVVTKSEDHLHTIDPLERRGLLSLQFLVTSMFIFQTSEPRDVIYSLLAVARDASPFAENSASTDKEYALFMRTSITFFLEEKPFRVDYGRPYSDVCRDFVEFIIQRSCELDPVQALDVLCRPWALTPRKNQSIRPQTKSKPTKGRWPIKTSGWKRKQEGQEVDDTRTLKQYFDEEYQKWESNESNDPDWKRSFPDLKKKKEERTDQSHSDSPAKGSSDAIAEADISLPCWVPLASSAPFGLFTHPGMDVKKTGRVNADPLVGVPEDGHRNYYAAQTKKTDLETLKFRRRPLCDRYSLYVRGFIFDEVEEVADASQNGSIPAPWLQLAGWEEPSKYDPPDEFWRTLVADRGKDNRNPPYYYARACRESAVKGGLRSGGINTSALINDERNSIIAEFCRRVQAVVWNRRLFKTKAGILGLASNKVGKGDKIGILYGCTVPVILREEAEKTDEEMRMEEFDDAFESLKSAIKGCEEKRMQRLRFRADGGATEDIKWHTKEINRRLGKDASKTGKSTNRGEGGGSSTPTGEENMEAEQEEQEESKKDKRESEDKKRKEDARRYYKLIGESYVHGMMDGDAMRKKFYERFPDQTLELT
ncbi:heterokaryon incompatibility protein-domain-containing protein [Hypoxylon cercidicola]|nr:heterokaryon incompatibility protein-domain-containing protein [Hypoxylon cercidicola]